MKFIYFIVIMEILFSAGEAIYTATKPPAVNAPVNCCKKQYDYDKHYYAPLW